MSDVKIHEERVQRGQQILAEVRKQTEEDEARHRAFAATVKSPNKKYVHRRDPAAAMVKAAISAPYSGELLRRSDCPYVVIGRVAFYAEDDLRALAESILNNVLPRHGTPDRRRRPAPGEHARSAA